MKRLALCGTLLLFVAVSTARAQDTAAGSTAQDATIATTSGLSDLPIVPETPDQVKELTQWLKDARAWQKWDQQWHGVAQWTWSGGVAPRRQQPEPPAWLADACTAFRDGRVVGRTSLVEACDLKRELSRNYNDLIAEKIERDRQWERTQYENVDKSWFFSKLHLDAPYIMAQSNGWRIFSYVGVHMTPFDIKKRVYIWLPPGVALISIPEGDGRKVMPAYGAGISIRWFDFRFPAAPQPSTMYFNVAEYFVQDQSIPGFSNRMTMMGLSFTAKKAK